MSDAKSWQRKDLALVPWQDRGRAYDSVDVRCGDGDMEKKVQGDMEKRVQESMVRVKSG